MMYKKASLLPLIFLYIFSLFPISVAKANVNTNLTSKITKQPSALIIYEQEKKFQYNENIINHLKELLYVFNESVDIVSLQEYEKNKLSDYDSSIIVNIRSDITNVEFLEDLSNYNKNIYWLGDKIENYLSYSNKYEMTYVSKISSINKLTYRDNHTNIQSGYAYNVINPAKESKVLASMSDSFNTYPYIIVEKNLYYLSRYDLEKSFIFDDSLYDFYNINEFGEGQIFVRIEDVHPFRDTVKLKEIADYLYSESVPFMIALIPTYVDSNTQTINTLDMVPEFVETIKYMQNKGGSIVLHGYTHQIGTEEISGEGYEFWNIEQDTPIEGDISQYVRDRLLSGLRLCIENEIYPLAFEAPHYAMNLDGYKELKKYFSTYVGQFQNNNENFTTSTFPFTIKNSENFNVFIPENLGFIEEGDEFSIDKIKNNFKKLSMVRGYTGGFFYHPYLDIDYLKECITYLKDNAVNFLDLKNEDNYIKIDDINIISKNGNIECTYDESRAITKVEVPVSSKFDVAIKKINNVVITFVSIILILFFVIFIIFKRINTNKFKRR